LIGFVVLIMEFNRIVILFFKGDIIKSPSGGANVIFTEVETLRIMPHEQPKPFKRPLDENSIIDTELVEKRVSGLKK